MINPFRLLGDGVHVAGKVLLLYRVITSDDCRGVSLQTQLLYLWVFCSRYLDLLTVFVSWYNTAMKALYILSTCLVCGVLYLKSRKQPPALLALDAFPNWALVVPSLLASLLPVYLSFYVWSVPAVMELLWYFSITLEAVAMLPQYVLMHKLGGDVDPLTVTYIVMQGSYRGLYLVSWLLRHLAQPWYWMPYLWGCGALQCLLFAVYVGAWSARRYLHRAPLQAGGDALKGVEEPMLADKA